MRFTNLSIINKQQGFSLVEIMLALGVSAIGLAVVGNSLLQVRNIEISSNIQMAIDSKFGNLIQHARNPAFMRSAAVYTTNTLCYQEAGRTDCQTTTMAAVENSQHDLNVRISASGGGICTEASTQCSIVSIFQARRICNAGSFCQIEINVQSYHDVPDSRFRKREATLVVDARSLASNRNIDFSCALPNSSNTGNHVSGIDLVRQAAVCQPVQNANLSSGLPLLGLFGQQSGQATARIPANECPTGITQVGLFQGRANCRGVAPAEIPIPPPTLRCGADFVEENGQCLAYARWCYSYQDGHQQFLGDTPTSGRGQSTGCLNFSAGSETDLTNPRLFTPANGVVSGEQLIGRANGAAYDLRTSGIISARCIHSRDPIPDSQCRVPARVEECPNGGFKINGICNYRNRWCMLAGPDINSRKLGFIDPGATHEAGCYLAPDRTIRPTGTVVPYNWGGGYSFGLCMTGPYNDREIPLPDSMCPNETPAPTQNNCVDESVDGDATYHSPWGPCSGRTNPDRGDNGSE